MEAHFTPLSVSPADRTKETTCGAVAGAVCLHDRGAPSAAVGSSRPSSRSDDYLRTRNVKQKGPNGAAICDSETVARGNAGQVADHTLTRAPASPATHAAHFPCAHRHACIPLTTPVWPPLCTDGPSLPNHAGKTISEWVRIIELESRRRFELHTLQPVASVITHELLVGVSDAIAALRERRSLLPSRCDLLTGRDCHKLLAKVTAAAVGGSFADDDDAATDALALKIGKRLTHQVGMITAAQAAIATRAQQARSSAQHRVHSSPGDGAAAQLPAQLALIREQQQADAAKNSSEIYVGFNELRRPVGTAEAPQMPVAPRASTRAMVGSGPRPPVATLDWKRIDANEERFALNTETDTAYWEGRGDAEAILEDSNRRWESLYEQQREKAARERARAQERLEYAERIIAEYGDLPSARRQIEWEVRQEVHQQHQYERVMLKVEIHSLEQKLAESQGGEAALRRVIAENVLRLRLREM